MSEEPASRNYVTTVLGCYCPRCREGKLFKNPISIRLKKNMDMNERCPLCHQRTEIEVGFYYGTGYVSYLLGILFTLVSFVLWFLIIGFSFHDRRFAFWLGANSIALVLMQPWLMRFSRALWLSFFVKYDPDWKYHEPEDPERIIESEMNNW